MKAPVLDENADTLTYSYYYKDTLKKGDDACLFTSFTFPSDFDNEDMLSLKDAFSLTVTGCAIQADGFDSVADAFAAFDKQAAEAAEAAKD